ncbi:hypothetical protein AVEN_112285-1 [Araneus ventricosus]|uniref:Uncharacterized protein n=1 Tax=Araneus ventricosus TaxID=182803 RepID=A0A4Y2H582_ARAVE|nr:hypothetical protein AVEN_112285-1 [Araneus ventricosus]
MTPGEDYQNYQAVSKLPQLPLEKHHRRRDIDLYAPLQNDSKRFWQIFRVGQRTAAYWEDDSSSLSNSDYSLQDPDQSSYLSFSDSETFPTISKLLRTPEIPQKKSVTSRRKSLNYSTQKTVQSLFVSEDKKIKKKNPKDIKRKKESSEHNGKQHTKKIENQSGTLPKETLKHADTTN